MAYTTTTLIGNALKRSLTADESAYLAILIPAVKQYIDRVLNSTFDNASETSRLFEARHEGIIDIDPCQAITAVELVDESETVVSTYNTDDYKAKPLNETIKRYLHMRFKLGTSHSVGNVKVTAKFTEYDFANSKVPEDIQAIATQICADVIGLISNAGGSVKSESIEGHSITYGNAVDNLDKIVENSPLTKGMLATRKELFLG